MRYLCTSQMRRILSISFVVAAVSMIFIATAVPHHHHAEGEFCATEAAHTEQGGNHAEHGYCVAESEFTEPSGREKICDCDPGTRDHEGHVHLFPLLCLFFTDIFSDPPAVTTEYGEFIILYRSVDAQSGGGLRAPPAILC